MAARTARKKLIFRVMMRTTGTEVVLHLLGHGNFLTVQSFGMNALGARASERTMSA